MAEYYVGEVRLFAFGQYAPRDFLPCDGRTLNISEHQALFAVIGTTYGGDGAKSFMLPNLCGRSPIHYGPLTGGTNYALGQTAGVEQVQLTSANVPAHNHIVSVTKAAATIVTPAPNVAPGDVGGNYYYCNEVQAGSSPQTAPQTVAVSGGGNQPHLNIQPSLVLSYAIAVNGIFPDFTN